jgi:LacI family transcriptional regulator
MSRFELARSAFNALRAHAEESETSARKREYNIQTDLIVRESTGFPRGTMTHLSKSNSMPKSRLKRA